MERNRQLGALVVLLALGLVGWWFWVNQPPAADETRVVYIGWDEQENEQLFSVGLDGAPPTQLTSAAQGILDYAVAPNGRRLVYAARQPDGGSDLWFVDRDGRNPRRVLDCAGHLCRRATWAPDNRRLVYELHRIAAPGEPPAAPRLWWYDTRTGETAPVFSETNAPAQRPRLSPDGRWLSYVAPNLDELHTINLDSGRLYVISSRTGEPAAWEPNGRSLLVTALEFAGERASARVLRLEIDSGLVTNLSGDIAVDDSRPAWSPDGTRIAVARTVPRTSVGRQLVIWDVAEVQEDGGHARRLTDDPAVQHGLPSWSPDGQFLVYQRFDLTGDADPAIWLIDVVSEEQRELASGGIQPAWLAPTR